jgi:hypothetical protein
MNKGCWLGTLLATLETLLATLATLLATRDVQHGLQ